MSFPAFLVVAAVLLLVRLAAQWLARGPRSAEPPRGRLSVWLWLLLYLGLLAGALVTVQRTGEVDPLGAAVVLISLGLRFAGLNALAGHYHEAIAVHESHGLVSTGVYRYLRHPLHLALLGEMAGLALLSGGLWTLPLVLATLVVLLHRNRLEERVLCERLGAPYRDYLAGPAWDPVDWLPGRSTESRS